MTATAVASLFLFANVLNLAKPVKLFGVLVTSPAPSPPRYGRRPGWERVGAAAPRRSVTPCMNLSKARTLSESDVARSIGSRDGQSRPPQNAGWQRVSEAPGCGSRRGPGALSDSED